jgi:hypothetical protein
MVAEFAKLEIMQISHFLDSVRTHRRRELNETDQMGKALAGDDPIIDTLIDDAYRLSQTLDLANQLAIVALYRTIETLSASALASRFSKNAAKAASHLPSLEKLLSGHGVILSSIPHYRVADELRLLNNAVKHSGKVSQGLSVKYKRWKQDAPLTQLDEAYYRLSPRVSCYLQRFVERIGADWPKNPRGDSEAS